MNSQNDNSTYLLLGCPVQAFSNEREVVSHLKNLVNQKSGGYSVAINAEKIQWYNNSKQIKSIIDNAKLRVPDGSGALLGMKMLHKVTSIKVDLPVLTLRCADENGFRVFLLGASLKHNSKAQKNIKINYPGISAVEGVDGFYDSLETVISQIQKFNPDVIMVAMGTPKQELVSTELHKKMPTKLFINCGGAVDIMSGYVKRAPKFYQNNHLEWFYRLIKNPSRYKRQIVLPKFLFQLINEYLYNNHSKKRI